MFPFPTFGLGRRFESRAQQHGSLGLFRCQLGGSFGGLLLCMFFCDHVRLFSYGSIVHKLCATCCLNSRLVIACAADSFLLCISGALFGNRIRDRKPLIGRRANRILCQVFFAFFKIFFVQSGVPSASGVDASA